MNLYLVRHGQTHSNLQGKYLGSFEAELSHQGVNEIRRTRGFIKHLCFDKVFSSERRRAIESARLLEAGEIVCDHRLNERDFGIFENKTYDEICYEYPAERKAWEDDWIDYKIPKGESVREAYERAAEFMKMLEKSGYNNCLTVTHGGIIRLIYCYVLGGDLKNFWRFASKNGSLSIVKLEYGNWHVDSIIQLDSVGSE